MSWFGTKRLCATAILLTFHCYAVSTDLKYFSGQNFALRRPAVQEPGEYDNFNASLAVDGNTYNDVTNKSCSHTNGTLNTEAWWKVFLENPLFVTGIVIYNRKEKSVWDRLENFKIYGDESFVIHDDSHKQQYYNDIIYIPMRPDRQFTSIKILIPGKSDSKSYLTLCEVQVYAASCQKPDVDDHVVVTNENVKYILGSYIAFDCDRGFKLTSYRSSTCVGDKEWSPVPPSCIIVKCPNPETLVNGYYLQYNNCSPNNLSDLHYDCTIEPRCNVGYKLHQQTIRTCEISGEWSKPVPFCTEVTCDYPGDISYGQYFKDNNDIYTNGILKYGTQIEGRCFKQYRTNDPTLRNCTLDGKWSGTAPHCFGYCSFEDLNALKNGHYVIKGLRFNGGFANYSETADVVCTKGYRPKTDSENVTCRSDGSWSSQSSECIIVTCLPPTETNDIKFKSWYNISYGSFTNELPYSATIETICQHGSLQKGSLTRQCKEDGFWDGSQPVCEETAISSPIAAISGAVSGSAVVVALAVLTIVVIYRKRHASSKPEQNGDKKYTGLKKFKSNTGEYAEISETGIIPDNMVAKVSTTSERSQETTFQQSSGVYSNTETGSTNNTYYSFSAPDRIPNGAILVNDLSDIVLSGETSMTRFKKEFENFPNGLTEKHTEAIKLQNRGKNRYRNMYAYDETRVVLQKELEEDSDYINACYIHGFQELRAYIASQGPTNDIILDFWKMIWQTESSKIVMLTKLIEEDKEKCDQYWPETGNIQFGNMTVSLEATEIYSDFTIRTLRFKKVECTDRIVTQFHYTAWPDKGVPKYSSSLVQFRNKVISFPSYGKGPIVVHCSAGVGRTGTFIALDYLTKQAQETGYVDVVGTVMALRKQRVNLVQTLEQYALIHHALVESLMLSTSALPSYKFPQAYQDLLKVDRNTAQKKINLEFEMLKKLSPVIIEDQYVSAKYVRNRNKNRYTDVLPVEEFMPCLSVEKSRDDGYINAVFLPSYKEKRAFIITQTPLESTKEDFWKLVWEHNVHSIVMMNHISEMEESEIYWPENEKECKAGRITVSLNGITTIDHNVVVSMTIESSEKRRCIKQIQCGGWPSEKSLPKSPKVILSIMELVQSWQQQTGNKNVLVHCMNGAEKSGLYCVISAVIDRMKIEQDVAISHVIQDMRNAREQIIPSAEQYQFCHEAVLAYIQQNETYSNFTL